MSVIRKLVANFGAISSVPRVSITGVAALYQSHSMATDAYHRTSIPRTVKSNRGKGVALPVSWARNGNPPRVVQEDTSVIVRPVISDSCAFCLGAYHWYMAHLGPYLGVVDTWAITNCPLFRIECLNQRYAQATLK